MTVLFKVLSFFPLWILHGLGWVLGWVAFLGSGVYRQRFLSNARQAGIARSQWLGAVGEAGKLVAELPRLWLGRPVPVQWDGAEHIEAALQRGKGAVCLTPHLGSFEITAQAYAERFGQFQQPMTVLFRPPRQTWLRELVSTSRERPGMRSAPTTMAGVKQMMKALKQGQTLGILPDQVPPDGLGLWAPFFGRDAYTMTLSARLVQQTGATVMVAWGERLSWGRGYHLHVLPPLPELPADTGQAVLIINQALEALILACPQQYLWGYARYKAPRHEV
jgi:Kdo2-lipid IVA lauroyltransferase/acyltransferase